MRKRFTRFALAATLSAVIAIPAVGFAGQVFADAKPNDHNCVGVRLSNLTPPGVGPTVKGIANGDPGAMAAVIAEIRAECADEG